MTPADLTTARYGRGTERGRTYVARLDYRRRQRELVEAAELLAHRLNRPVRTFTPKDYPHA